MSFHKFLFVSGVLLFSLLSLAFFSPSAHAAESICPGGSSPRGDIVWCGDFENLTNCATGTEDQCWSGNGFQGHQSDSTYGWKVIPGSDAAVGSSYTRSHPLYGATGSGYENVASLIPTNAINYRFYVRFSKGYMDYGYDHGPGIKGQGSGCATNSLWELSPINYTLYVTSTCQGGSFNFQPNQPNPPVLQNNRWYLVEIQQIADTSCTSPPSSTGCNGIGRAWVDGVKVWEYTNVNWGHTTNGVQFAPDFGPANYYHVRNLPWSYEIAYDNFAYSNNGTYIGPAANENPRGTGDPSSPYIAYQGIEPFIGRHPASDCSTPSGYLGSNYGYQWRNGGVLESTIRHDNGVRYPFQINPLCYS